MRRGVCLVTPFEEFHRRIDAAGPARHARRGKTHLDARQRSHQGKLVALAEVADAKHLAGNLAEAGAERHVVFSSTVLRNLSASWPGGISTAVSTGENSDGSRHSTSSPHC